MSDDVDGEKSTPLSRTFQTHEIVAIPFEGELLIILTQLERAWGYAPKGLAKQLARWEAREQVRDGIHYRKLTNGKLAAFKSGAGRWFADCEPVDVNTRNLLVVTERGLYRLLTLIPDKAIAIAFQDWLESEVLPAINRTGGYQATRALPGPTSPPALPGATKSSSMSAGPPGVQVLRRVLERMRPAMEPGAYAALDALVEEVEDTTEATAAASSIDAIPVPRDRREGAATEDIRITLCGQASSALVGLRTDDLHRLIVWSATRPLRGQARRALTTRGGGR